MNVIKIMGGLGNQLCQYATGKHLEQYDSIAFDISYYDEDINKNGSVPHRDFLLPKLVDNLTYATQEDRERVNQWEYKLGTVYKNKYFWGDWQKASFFKDADLKINLTEDIMDEAAADILEHIRDDNSVAIHIRRTDYIGLGWALDVAYYEKAMAEILKTNKNAVFYIFSDDLSWSEENLYGDVFVKFDTLTDLYLMSECKHNIIANSTYSFWAAYLNKHQDKKVIYPKDWICTSNPVDCLPWIGI